MFEHRKMLKKIVFILLLVSSYLEFNAQCVPGSPPLPTVVVDSVSVLPNGDIIICWQVSNVPDILEYDIIMFDPITLADLTIATIPAGGATCYTIPSGSANNFFDTEVREYGVRVKDNCGNASLNGDNYHNTMLLEYSINICAASINFTWNAYDDFTSGTNVLYELFVSQDAAPFISAGTTNSTNITYTGVVQGSNYQFYIRTIENNGAGPITSSTNIVDISANFFLKDPSFLYLYTATVEAPTQIDVQFYVDTFADARVYNIQRKQKITDAFVTVGSVPAFKGMNPFIVFNDYDVDAEETSYYYQIEMVNLCNQTKIISNIGKTIFLEAYNDKLELTNTLTWSAYEGWLGNVTAYEIYRSIGGIWETTPLATVSALVGENIYIDDVSTTLEGDGEFCYKIVGVEGGAAHPGALPPARSSSNEVCVEHVPLIYIPNAFDPLSTFNPVFKPVLTFADPLSYEMIIFDRWGQKVFETNDINEGWNGAFNNKGEFQAVGSYVYSIKFKSAPGKDFAYRGLVTLIR